MSNTVLTDKSIYRQPSETYTLSEQPRPLSIELFSPSFYTKSPSIPLSVTSDTDIDYDSPANAFVRPETMTLADSKRFGSRSVSRSRSRSRSSSHSFSESKIAKLYKDSQEHKKTHIYQILVEQNDECDEDNECDPDDLNFNRILLSLSRQESRPDKRRLSLSHFPMTPLQSVSHNSLIPIASTSNPVPTRKRRADTIQFADVESSKSTSCFDALQNSNISIPVPTHRQKWPDSCNDDTESDRELCAPSPPQRAQLPCDRFLPRQPAMRIGVSADSFLSDTTFQLIGGSNSLAFATRARSSSIRPHGFRGSVEENDPDMNGSDSPDSDDVDVVVTDLDDDEKHIDPKQAELVFATTAQSLMVSCGDSREVFAILRTMCITLKKDESLPYTIEFAAKILKYDHVESFLKLLGFVKNKKSQQWICYKERRAENRLIDCGVLECHKCLQEIQKHESINDLVSQHRHNTKKSKHSLRFSPEPPALTTIQQSQSFEQSLAFMDDDEYERKHAIGVGDADSVQIHELIWSITHNNNDDHDAEDVLLLTYPLVTTAKNILLCCEARFFSDDYDGRITVSNTSTDALSHVSYPSFNGMSSPRTSTRSSMSEFNKNHLFNRSLSSFSVQANVIGFIRHWMRRYWDKDWDDNSKLLGYCKAFIRRIRKAYQSAADDLEAIEIKKGKHIIELLEKTMTNEKRKTKIEKVIGVGLAGHDDVNKLPDVHTANVMNVRNKRLRNQHKKQRSRWSIRFGGSTQFILRPKELVDVNYVTIAEQITVSQFKQYQNIHPRECLKQAWKDQENKKILAPNITEYINSFNRLTKWIQSSILVAENLKSRGKTIKKWVKVEEELYKLRNFQALCAVYAALGSTPIWNLKEAWSEVKKKHITEHEMIKVIMKSTQNWKNLRRLQLETHPPMLPYFGMFAQDLIVIEETTSNRSNDGSINWGALWRVNATIKKHLDYQKHAYHNLTENATLQRWMQKELYMSGKLDDEWVYQVSNHVARKDKNEASNRKKSARSLFKSK